MFACAPDFIPPAPDVTVNFTTTQQTIDGFGAADSPQGLTSTLADFFFTTIGLSLFRLGWASNSAGPTPYYVETVDMATFWNDAKLAGDRGAVLWATPWTATDPTWKDNGSWVSGNLNAGHYADWATIMAGFPAALFTNTGYRLYAMSVGNEPDFVAPYSSMLWSAANMTTFIKNNLGPALAALSPVVLLIAPECENWDHSVSYVSTILADSTAASFTNIIATHQYEGTVAAFTGTGTRKIWETEMSGIGGVFDPSMANGLTFAGWVHSALTTGNVNAWLAWITRNPNPGNEGLIGDSGDDATTKRVYVMGNYAKFIRPGYVRVGITGSVSGVSMTAFRQPSTGHCAIVAINTNTSIVHPVVLLSGLGFSLTTITPWVTDATNNLATQGAASVVGNTFTMTLPASSVTSYVGIGI